MKFLDNEGKLFNLELLALDFAILVLYLAVGNVEVGLQFFELCNTDNIFANLHDSELKLLIFNSFGT
mgnify:CR=1 FL=1